MNENHTLTRNSPLSLSAVNAAGLQQDMLQIDVMTNGKAPAEFPAGLIASIQHGDILENKSGLSQQQLSAATFRLIKYFLK